MHESSLIFTIGLSLAVAFVLGFIALKLKLSPVAGYLLAGILIGPHTPGLVADTQLTSELSEIGIILLMFGVGLHFSVNDLLAARRAALLGALPQVLISGALGITLGVLFGWDVGAASIFGLALSAASTVVVINGLEQRATLKHLEGKLAIGWLLVQDLAMVLALVLLPALSAISHGAWNPAGYESAFFSLVLAIGKAAFFIGLMIIVGRRFFPWILSIVATTGSRELFTLFVIAVPISIALLAAHLFQVSVALGAFFAGIVLNESDLSHRAAANALPMQDAFAVLFFVSTGMLFNPSIILTHPAYLAAALALVLVANPLIAFVLIALLRYPVGLALAVAANFSQIGEFSVLLSTLGMKLNMIGPPVHSLIIAIVLISICLNSVVYSWWQKLEPVLLLRLRRYLKQKNVGAPIDDTQLRDHVVLIGYGRVGSRVGQELLANNIPFSVIEQDRELAADLHKKGVTCVEANAEVLRALEQAGVPVCRMLIVTANDPFETRTICQRATSLNPTIRIVVRTHSDEENRFLEQSPGVELVVFGENELANAITRHVLDAVQPSVENR
jgi:CPA2 family monovalent cation:H+ antiporter-2